MTKNQTPERSERIIQERSERRVTESWLGNETRKDQAASGSAVMSEAEALSYVPVRRRTRQEILASLSAAEPQEIRDALISAAYWDEDWRWAEQQLVKFAEHNDELVLWAVIAGFGFIAAFHGEIDLDVVLPILERLKDRPALAGDVEETLAEIDHFVIRRKSGEDIHLGRRLPEDWRPSGQR